MRYTPPGLCLNDFNVSLVDGVYALTHLQGPWTRAFDHVHMESSFGRATSTDLVSWASGGVSFGVGAPGRFDDTAVWTMHTFPAGSGRAMAYTGVSEIGWPDQSVGIAHSQRTDDTEWGNPSAVAAVTADPRWYRTGPQVAWRDPFVVEDDEGRGWAMVVCASDAGRPFESAGCVAFATSPDLSTWTVHPPIVSPGWTEQLECPVLHRTATGWLLIGGVEGRCDAWTADRLQGEWTHVGALSPIGAYAGRVIEGPAGETLLLHTCPRRVDLSDDGAYCRGTLAQPKLLDLSDAARPVLRWWEGLDAWVGDVCSTPSFSALIDVELGRPGTIVLRRDDAGGEMRLVADDDGIALHATDGRELRRVGSPAIPGALRILCIGEYVEVYADGIFVLCGLSYLGEAVDPVLISTDGTSALTAREVRVPSPTRTDAGAIWRGPRKQVTLVRS